MDFRVGQRVEIQDKTYPEWTENGLRGTIVSIGGKHADDVLVRIDFVPFKSRVLADWRGMQVSYGLSDLKSLSA